MDEIGEKLLKVSIVILKYSKFIDYRKLSKEGINFKIDNKNKSNILNGKTFVISGTFEILSREEIKQLVLENGGKLSSLLILRLK